MASCYYLSQKDLPYQKRIRNLEPFKLELTNLLLRMEGKWYEIFEGQLGDQEIYILTIEIKKLIDQLSTNHPINSTTNAMKIATQTVENIETNINLKQKATAADKKGLLEGLKTNPVGAFVAGAIEGWIS